MAHEGSKAMIALNRNHWFDYHVESLCAAAALQDTRKILYATFTALPGKEAEVAALIAGLQVPLKSHYTVWLGKTP